MNGTHYPREFEPVHENFSRLRVPGGWIVHHCTEIINGGLTHVLSESMVFVPDENSEWILKSK